MAIHFSNTNKTLAENTGLVERTMVSTRINRPYTKSTLFEGNGKKLLWSGLGRDVSEANSAYEVCKLAGLDYEVRTEKIYTADGMEIPNMVATRRYDIYGDIETPSTVYGAVTNRYVPVQNYEGFEFIDALFHRNGFEVETAGQFNDGKIVWVEAKLPERVIVDEKIMPYIVFTNRHDGKGSVRIFLSPTRVICRNTLNYAIKGAKDRTFSVKHTNSAVMKLEQAKQMLYHYDEYLEAMAQKIEQQKRCLLEQKHVDNMLSLMFPFSQEDTARVKETAMRQREEVRYLYDTVDDLDGYENSGFKFVNAVSDWATHHTPARQTANYRNNLFQKTLEGNKYIDMAVDMIDEFDAASNKMIVMA